MNPQAKGVLLAVLWTAWWLPFFVFVPRNRGVAVRRNLHARWGVVLEAVAFFVVYLHAPQVWLTPTPWWRIAVGSLLALCAILLSWTSVIHLGRQWRIDAGINADHQLIRTGPYSIVRHPIYAAMFCMLLMSVLAAGTLPGWPIAIAIFVTGTAIRVRAEDGLLRERFGEAFHQWSRTVPAWLPFVR